MEKKYSHLVKNTMIFAVGTFGSKVLTFLIIPLYTYYLTTAEYGNIDLFTTTVNMLVPFLTLTIQEAIIRFLVAKEAEPKVVLNNCMLVFSFGAIVSILLLPVYWLFFKSWTTVGFFVTLLILTSYNTIFSQYLRATGKNVAFTINGLIVTSVTVFSNLILLVGFKSGVLGYYISLVLAQAFASMQVTICGNIFRQLSLKLIDKRVLKQMLRYSIPLVPNSLMWWIMNAGDKYVIRFFLGSDANGIYSVAMKIPTILSLLFTIFMQAWQLSALEESDTKERSHFFNSVFATITGGLYLATAFIVLVVEKLFVIAINPSFFEAWMYVPTLCLATIVNCFATFSGVVYTINKHSKKAFLTTLAGACANLTVNFFLIIPFGLYGVAIGTLVGYVVVAAIRMFDCYKDIGTKFDLLRTAMGFSLLIIDAVLAATLSGVSFYMGSLAVVFVLLYLYRGELSSILKTIVSKIAKRKITG
jgi:O-antigen/teichoic acid export membrane protein